MALSGSLNTSSYDGRYYTLSWTATQSVTNNTSTIEWTLSTTGGNSSWYAERTLKVVVAGSTVYSKTDRAERYAGTIASGSLTVTHGTDGTKSFSASMQAAVYGSSVNCTGSATFSLNTIPRKSTLSVGNGTLGTAQTLTVTKQSSSFTHTITATCGSSTVTLWTKASATSGSFTPPLDWAKQNTTGTTVTVKYSITTYSGSTNIGTNSYTKTCSIPASVKPSCAIAVSDAAGYADIYGGYIKGYSKFAVNITATTSYNSPIASYSASANGSNYSKASFTTGEIKAAGTQTITATVTDKRSRSGNATANVTVLDYSQPNVTSLKVKRCDADGTENINGEYAQITFSATATPLNNLNTVNYSLQFKKQSEADYSTVDFIEYKNQYNITDLSYIFAADSSSTYNARIVITDGLTSVTKTTVISTAEVLMHWRADGKGMGLGKVGEIENGVDIGYKTRFAGGIEHLLLEPETDLNEIKTPNIYIGANVASYNYLNCPFDNGTFTLEVFGAGVDGQVKQKITDCNKTDARSFERFFYENEWGAWVCVSDFLGKLLWDGSTTANNGYFMNENQTIALTEAISKQPHGIVLVFSYYTDGSGQDYNFQSFFISKVFVALKNGKGHQFPLANANYTAVGGKYLYISDTQIKGNAHNETSGTNNGVSFDNKKFVLRYVIGV